jgi:hypothetical protein
LPPIFLGWLRSFPWWVASGFLLYVVFKVALCRVCRMTPARLRWVWAEGGISKRGIGVVFVLVCTCPADNSK